MGLGMRRSANGPAVGRWCTILRVVASSLVLLAISSFGLAGQAQALTSTITTLTSTPNPSIPQQDVSLTATVSGAGGTPTGTVTFNYGDGSPNEVVGMFNGTASVPVHKFLVAGTFTVTATYNGDATFVGSVGTTTQNVAKAATTTTLVSTPNPSLPQQDVSLTATVSGAGGTPTGTVTFNYGDGSPNEVVGMFNGTASVPVHKFLVAGTFTVTATYNGDATFVGSVGTTTQNVAKTETATALVSSPNQSLPAQPVTFTANVSGAGGTPTGTVTLNFADCTTTTGPVTGGGTATANHSYA